MLSLIPNPLPTGEGGTQVPGEGLASYTDMHISVRADFRHLDAASLSQKFFQLVFVNRFHAQRPRFFKLGPRVGSHDDVICFLAH